MGSGDLNTTAAQRDAAIAVVRYADRQRDHLPGYGDDPTAEQVWLQLADDARSLAAAVLQALEAGGFTVVQLPTPARLVVAIRAASYDYWHSENTLGCDTRGLAPAKHVAKALLAAASQVGETEQ